ncbi:unnamed protein product [Effrenium voratum]|uniref:cGMP-dependent protein kinase n=1 Tax=Effrenium voratum TaxID=2562239 RepID=A0AA36JS57_9DINO|nr:unnamed protein product [Effrenium voratum]
MSCCCGWSERWFAASARVPPAWEVVIRRRDCRGADVWAHSVHAPPALHKALREAAQQGDPNVTSAEGCLALNEAVKANCEHLVRSLIEADADAEKQDATGESALENARRLKNGQLLKLLQSVSCKKRTLEFQEGLKLVQDVPVFATIHPSEYPRLAAAFETRQVASGEVILHQGDASGEMFLVAKGVADVLVEENGSPPVKVSELCEGSHFGEGALLEQPCESSVVAASEMLLKVLSLEAFEALGLKSSIRKREAVRTADDYDAMVNESLKRKTGQEAELIRTALSANNKLGPLVQCLSTEDLDNIAANAWRLTVEPGQEVIQQGSIKADNFYIVFDGHLEVIKDGEKVLDVYPGNSFGELALLYRAPRAATVRSLTQATLFAVPRQDLRMAMQAPLKKKLEGFAALLSQVEILQHLGASDKELLANHLVEMTFYEGETIIQQGEEGYTFYILYDGEVSVLVDGEEVTQLLPGNFFGERALLNDEPRAATIMATSPKVRVLALDREHFLSVVEKDEMWHGLSPKALVKYELRALKQIGLIGCGGFGTVTLRRCTLTNNIFALKTLSKGYIVQRQQEQSVINEKNVLRMTQSPFIIRLAATFNEPQRLHFLLEPALGGDLFTVYQRNNLHGSNVHSRFYVAAVIRAFQHLHQRHIIYRDMKPENLLLDSKGYCKVTDFGLAKFVIGHAYTTCGTPEYFAPEMVLHMGHTIAVDWWSLGVLTFELMAGDSPFTATEPMQVFNRIKAGIQAVAFPKSPTGPWVDVVHALCQEEPSERLPMRKNGIASLEAHDWYADFDWPDFDARTMQAPYCPNIKRPDSLANFDVGDVRRPPMIPYMDTGTGWDADFEDCRGPRTFN